MQDHKKLNDAQFEEEFSSCKLSPELFTHEAHIRLAWIHINKYGLDLAIENVTTQLKDYVRTLGSEDKYNATVTVAALKAVNHFILKSGKYEFEMFIRENPELLNNFKGLLSTHYSFNIFESEKAKANFLEPDKSSF